MESQSKFMFQSTNQLWVFLNNVPTLVLKGSFFLVRFILSLEEESGGYSQVSYTPICSMYGIPELRVTKVVMRKVIAFIA